MPSARTLSLLALAVAVLFPAEVFGDQEKGAGGLVWERPEPGLTQAREKRQPIFLVVPGKEPESFWATLESELTLPGGELGPSHVVASKRGRDSERLRVEAKRSIPVGHPDTNGEKLVVHRQILPAGSTKVIPIRDWR